MAGLFLQIFFTQIKFTAMKKTNSLAAVLVLLLISTAACYHHNYRTRTVRMNDGNRSLKIEYCGEIDFTTDERGIEAIEPEGYVIYRDNSKRFIAESDEDGDITYKIYEGGKRLHNNDDGAREIMASAVKEIAEHYDR